jgi:hypothetical protein
LQGILSDAVAEEKTASFDCRAKERGADPTVESNYAFRPEGLAETVNGARISEREVLGLGLKSHFDGVEGILDCFADNACEL